MNAQEFCYWLKGYFELSKNRDSLTPEQVKIINDHLRLVFNKVTPEYQPLDGLNILNTSHTGQSMRTLC